MDERRAKNLCFFCDEKYFPGHKCKAHVYRLEIVEEEEEEEEAEETEEQALENSMGEANLVEEEIP